MVISLCGDEKGKNVLINELIRVYGDKIVICNYFNVIFNTVIDNEAIKYRMIDDCDNLDNAREMFSNYIKEMVSTKIYQFLKVNKDKIIILISNNILTYDIDKTSFFKNTDLKLLITSDDKFDNKDYLLNCKELYDINSFDYVIKNGESIDIKRLVRLW